MSEKANSPVISQAGRRHLQLHLTPEVGPIRLRSLINRLGSAEAVLAASRAELQGAEGIGPKLAEAIFQSRQVVDVEAEVQKAAAHQVRIICWDDDEYPATLRQIPDPPICLYVRGQLAATDAVAVAVVGTRRCSHYGREQAMRFGELLAGAGFTVISGLARGIDGAAHEGALRGGGRTIAVLGNGLSNLYPAEHEALAEKVLQQGALVSELPMDVGPDAGHFPRRNRIIIGLSLGVIVVEAGKGSGALITARLASEYNREVFAVPGRIDQADRTAGVHALIRDGQAKLVTCLEDILDELGPVGEIMARGPRRRVAEERREDAAESLLAPMMSATEQAVVAAIGEDTVDAGTIIERAGIEAGTVMSALTSLQLKGVLKRLATGQFAARQTSK